MDDVVVDEYDELLWRLRALYGLKNFLGTRIVALGGPWGKYSPEAPQVAREKYRFNIIDIPYDQIAPRIKAARENRDTIAAAQRWTEAYLALPHTTLSTTKEFVTNAFVLYGLFKDLLREHDACRLYDPQLHEHDHADGRDDALPDVGPAQRRGPDGFLRIRFRHHPRRHPPAPRRRHARLPAQFDLPARRHRDLRPLQQPAPARRHALRAGHDRDAFRVRVRGRPEGGDAGRPTGDVPRPRIQHRPLARLHGPRQEQPDSYEICRSQQEVEIQGDWKKLLNEVRDSHWMMAYGDHVKELAYATRKLGIQWADLS